MSRRLRQQLVRRLESASAMRRGPAREAFLEVPRESSSPTWQNGWACRPSTATRPIRPRQMRAGTRSVRRRSHRIVARMLEELRVLPAAGLEIGSGTGYNAALLSVLVGPKGHVTSIELAPRSRVERDARCERPVGDRTSWSGTGATDGRRTLLRPDRRDRERSRGPRAFLEQLAEGGLLVLPDAAHGPGPFPTDRRHVRASWPPSQVRLGDVGDSCGFAIVGGPVAAVAGVEGRGDTRWHRPNVGLVIGGHVGPALGGSAEEPFRAGFRASGARYTCGQPGSRSGTARLAATSLEGCPSRVPRDQEQPADPRGERRTTTGVRGLCSMHELPVRLGRCRCPARDGRSGTGSDGRGRSCSSGSALPRARAGAGDRGAGSRTHEFSSPPHAARRASTKATKRSGGRFPDPAPTLSGRERTRSVDELYSHPNPVPRSAAAAGGVSRPGSSSSVLAAVEGGGLPGHIRGSGTCWALGLPPRRTFVEPRGHPPLVDPSLCRLVPSGLARRAFHQAHTWRNPRR